MGPRTRPVAVEHRRARRDRVGALVIDRGRVGPTLTRSLMLVGSTVPRAARDSVSLLPCRGRLWGGTRTATLKSAVDGNNRRSPTGREPQRGFFRSHLVAELARRISRQAFAETS